MRPAHRFGMLNLSNESAKLEKIKAGGVMADRGKALTNAFAFTVT